jgi:hypothetical protein
MIDIAGDNNSCWNSGSCPASAATAGTTVVAATTPEFKKLLGDAF